MPRCQLALTLLLAEAAGSRLATPPQLFDPAFTEVRLVLERCAGQHVSAWGKPMFACVPHVYLPEPQSAFELL